MKYSHSEYQAELECADNLPMVNRSSSSVNYGWVAEMSDPSLGELRNSPSKSGRILSWIDGEFDSVPNSGKAPTGAASPSMPLSAQLPEHGESGKPTNVVFVTFSPFGGSEEDSMGQISGGWLDGSEKYGLASNESWLPTEAEAPFLYSLGDAGDTLDDFGNSDSAFDLSQGTTLLDTAPETTIFPSVNSFDTTNDSKRASSSDPWLRFRARRDELAEEAQNEILEAIDSPKAPEPERRRPRESFWDILDRTAQLAVIGGPKVQLPVSFEVDVPSADIHNPGQMVSQASYVSQVQANAEEMTGSFPQVTTLDETDLPESEANEDPLENHPYFDNLEKKHEAFQASGSIDTDLEKGHKKIWHRQSDDVSITSKKFRKRKN